MAYETKIRELLNPRLREIHSTINGAISMGDLAVYVGQPMFDAMAQLVETVIAAEVQRAVEICDFALDSMIDRDKCARALRDPYIKYPSEKRY